MKMSWEITVSDSIPSQFAFDTVEICVTKKSDGNDDRILKLSVSPSYYITNEFLNNINEQYTGEIPFTDLFRIKNAGESLWQFMPAFAWPEFNRIIKLYEGFTNLFSDEKPDVINFCPQKGLSNYYVYLFLKQYTTEHGIQLKLRSGRISIFLNSLNNSLAAILLKHIARKLYFSVKNKNIKKTVTADQYDGLFLTYGRRYLNFDKEGQFIKDTNFDDTIQAINEKKKQRVLIIDLDNFIETAIVSDRGYTVAPLNSVTENYPIQEMMSFLNLLRHNLRSYSFFRNSQRDKIQIGARADARLLRIFPALVKRMFFDYSFIASGELKNAERIIRKFNPSLIGMTYETGTFQRAMIIKAEKKGIRTYGFQHGMIFDNHYDYCHKGVAADKDKSWHFATPDTLFVWGEYWKSILTTKFSYPLDKVIASGYSKANNQTQADKKASGRIGIFSNYIMTAEFIDDVVAVLNNAGIKDFFIKLHPTENNIETKNKIRNLVKQDVEFIDELNNAFEQANLIICQYSTIISEGVLYNKDVVLCDFYNLGFPEAYETFEVVYKANNTEELQAALYGEKPFAADAARLAFIQSFFGNYAESAKIIANKIHSDISE